MGGKGKAKSMKSKGGVVITAMPALYTKDLGNRGIKRFYSATLPPASISKVPLTVSEKKRRKERQVSDDVPDSAG